MTTSPPCAPTPKVKERATAPGRQGLRNARWRYHSYKGSKFEIPSYNSESFAHLGINDSAERTGGFLTRTPSSHLPCAHARGLKECTGRTGSCFAIPRKPPLNAPGRNPDHPACAGLLRLVSAALRLGRRFDVSAARGMVLVLTISIESLARIINYLGWA